MAQEKEATQPLEYRAPRRHLPGCDVPGLLDRLLPSDLFAFSLPVYFRSTLVRGLIKRRIPLMDEFLGG